MARIDEPSSSSSQNTSRSLYVNTNNPDTYFIMEVREEDTIAQVKQKVSVNYEICFPRAGEIIVRSLKVKRGEYLYVLMDDMILKHIFDTSRNWCLFVEAAQKPLYLEPAANTHPQVPLVDGSHVNGICGKHVSGSATPAGDLVNTLGGVMGSKLEEMVNGGQSKKHKRNGNEGGENSKHVDSLQKAEVTKRKKSKKDIDAVSKPQLHANEPEQTFNAHVNEVVEFPKPADLAAVVNTGVSTRRRRMKSKKDMVADPKVHLHANEADDTGKGEQTFEVDANEGVEFSKPVDSFDVVNTEALQKKRSKKSKKGMEADSMTELHADADDDTSKHEHTFDAHVTEGVEFPKPVNSSVVVNTEASTRRRRIKSKKDMNADPKVHLHANDADDTGKGLDADANERFVSKPVDSSVVVNAEALLKKRSTKPKKGMGAGSKAQIHANADDDTSKHEQTFDADVNQGVGFSKPVSSPVVVMTESRQKKRSKKSKKDNDADPKVHLHANDADDAAKCDQTFSTNVHAVEVPENNSISTQAGSRQNLEVYCGGGEVGSAENDMLEVEKVLVQNDDPKMIPETTDTILKTKDLDVSAKSTDGTGDIVAQDPSHTRKRKSKKDVVQLHAHDADKPVDSSVLVKTEAPQKNRKKKPKKDMDADSKTKLHANDADDTSKCEQTFDADVGAVELHKKNSISIQLESGQNLEVRCGSDQAGLAENDMIEVEKALVQNGPKMIPETTDSKLKTAELDVSAKSADATGNVLAQYPLETRKKKVKKNKNSDAKINVSTSQLENVEGAGDTVVLQGHPGVEPQNGDAILCETEGGNASKVDCLNAPARISVTCEYQERGREETSLNKVTIVRDQETIEKINDNAKLKSVKPPTSTSKSVTDHRMKRQIEAQDPMDMRKKKVKKAKNPKARNSISTSLVEHVEGPGDILVVQNHPGAELEKGEIILSDIEGVKEPNLERRNTLAEGTVNTDYQGSELVDHFVPRNDNPDLVILAEQLGEMGFHQTKHDKELESNKETEMPTVDPTCIISDLEIPQESVDNHVLGTSTQQGSSDISKLQDMRIEANPSEKAMVNAGKVHSSSNIPSRLAVRKPGSKKTREVGSQKGKNLLTASDRIFDQNSSERSADINASTLSPSDASSLSDQLEGEGLNSPSKGFYVRKAEENGGNNSSKLQSAPVRQYNQTT